MKRKFRFVVIVCMSYIGFFNPVHAQSQSDAGTNEVPHSIPPKNPIKDLKIQQIHDLLESQLKAWNQGDMKGYMQGYWNSDSLQFITAKGVTMGYETVLANYSNSFSTRELMGNLDFEITNLNFLDNDYLLAQVVGTWKVQTANKTSNGTFSLIIKFFGNTPKIIIDHTF